MDRDINALFALKMPNTRPLWHFWGKTPKLQIFKIPTQKAQQATD